MLRNSRPERTAVAASDPAAGVAGKLPACGQDLIEDIQARMNLPEGEKGRLTEIGRQAQAEQGPG